MANDKLPGPQHDGQVPGHHESWASLDAIALHRLDTGVAIVGRDGRCEYANAALLDMLGCSADDLIGSSLHDAVHASDGACGACGAQGCPLLHAMRRPLDAPDEFEAVFNRRDDRGFIVVCKVRPFNRGDEQFIALEIRDVTRERQAELLARAQGIGYQFAAHAARFGSWSRDLRTNVVTICPVMAELIELPADHAVLSDSQWRRLILAEDLPEVDRKVAQFAQTGELVDLEYRVHLPSGRIMWLSSRGSVSKDARGDPVAVTGMSMDITERKEMEAAVRASEERFRLLAELSPAGIFVVENGVLVYTNQVAASILGATDGQSIVGLSPLSFIEEKYRDRATGYLQQVLKEERLPLMEHILHRLDGKHIWVQSSAGLVTWQGRQAIQIVARDITEEKHTREKLRIMNERVNLALASAGEAVWDWNVEADSVTFTGGLKSLFDWTDAFSPNSPEDWAAIVYPDDLSSLLAAIQACMDNRTSTCQCEFRLRTHGGTWRWVVMRGVVVAHDEQGKPLSLTGTLTDISARKESDEQAWRHANLDPLTGLPNRRLYHERLERELDRAQRSGKPLALLFIDLDRFKQVNDCLGHAAGDQLLAEAARRIQQCVRKTDTVARLGGDEFTVLLADLEGLGHVEFVSQKVIEALVTPFHIGKEMAYISCSIGIALYPADATAADDLLRKADQAMYAAKECGRQQFKYFTRTMDETAHRRLTLTNELRQAIGKGQMSVHYQPVVRLSDRRIVKAEALARWRHPWLGPIQPSEFIPLAEEAGLIGSIGNWVLEQAVSQSGRWADVAGTAIQVGVNQSPLEFALRDAQPGRVASLAETGMAGANISVEITESALLNASTDVAEKLLRYRDAGIQVAIDDFGTGYSSLAYLQQFDIDYLKIDKSFVHDIGSNDANRTIVETIILMAHKLGLQVIAEGIETPEQMRCLESAGCDYGQGFLFSPAVPAREFERILASGQWQPSAQAH